MPLIDRKRPKIGDVIEIETPRGYAYAQYTHKHVSPPCFGALIRVLNGIWATRPENFNELVGQGFQFVTFFPLGAACSRGIVKIVASEPIPSFSQSFPIFRNTHRDIRGNRAGDWFLWDGQKEWRVSHLTNQQLKEYPPAGVINDTLLIERIVSGWRHESEQD